MDLLHSILIRKTTNTETVASSVVVLLTVVCKFERPKHTMAEESSISGSSDSASHEGIIRSTIVSVPAISRLRSMSGTLFAPSGCGRVRRESGPSSTNGTSNLTSSASGGGTSPRSNRLVVHEFDICVGDTSYSSFRSVLSMPLIYITHYYCLLPRKLKVQ